MKIKMIIQHHYRRYDSYGNTYWFVQAINTNTGRSLFWESPHSSNAESSVLKAGYTWDEVHICGTVEMPARDYDAQIKALKEHNNLLRDSCQDAKIIKAISNLKRKS